MIKVKAHFQLTYRGLHKRGSQESKLLYHINHFTHLHEYSFCPLKCFFTRINQDGDVHRQTILCGHWVTVCPLPSVFLSGSSISSGRRSSLFSKPHKTRRIWYVTYYTCAVLISFWSPSLSLVSRMLLVVWRSRRNSLQTLLSWRSCRLKDFHWTRQHLHSLFCCSLSASLQLEGEGKRLVCLEQIHSFL